MPEIEKWRCPVCSSKTSLVIQPPDIKGLWFNLEVCWKCRNIYYYDCDNDKFIELKFNKPL